MPKNYLTSNNLKPSLLLIAKNIDQNFNLKKTETATYVSKLLKGIIDDKTVVKNLPKEFRKPYGILQKCELCGKKKIKDMNRHIKNTHSNPMTNPETVARITK